MEIASKTIMVFCAHNDDNIIGAGGTLAKYADEGKRIITVFFTYGEGSHPFLRKNITQKIRVQESTVAAKIIGEKKVLYLGLTDGKIGSEIKKDVVKNRLRKLILQYHPEKVFTHSPDELHPDHRAVNHAVLSVIDHMGAKCDVYTFPVWHLLSIKERREPKMYVDITSTFNRKIEALRAHKSQTLAIYSLSWNIYMKAFINGLTADCRYAECFYKVR